MTGCILRSLHLSCQLSPNPRRVSFRINVFGACSAFTARYGLLSRQATFMALSTRGSRRVVTFTTTPVATGRSEIAGRGLHPLGNCAFPRRTERSHLNGFLLVFGTDRPNGVSYAHAEMAGKTKDRFFLPLF